MNDDQPKKRASQGWYPDAKRPDERRRWDGEQWLDQWQSDNAAEKEPGSLMRLAFFVAIIVAAGGAIFLALEYLEWVALVVWGIGGFAASTMVQIGAIAKGVQMGNRASH